MTGDRVSVIGCVQMDLVMTPVAELPPEGATRFVDELGMRAGGAGANAALALADVGIMPRLIGALGDDQLGQWLLEDMRAAGLADELLVVAGAATGATVAAEAPGRDRSFLTYLGVNETWNASMVAPDVLDADHVLFCDYFAAPGMQGASARTILEGARAAGARTYFDTAWDPLDWPDQTRLQVQELLPLVDVFLPNEGEACAIAGCEDAAEAARILQQISGGWVVVKLGADGCLAVGPGGVELSAEAPPVTLVDSTGAGDAFNAGLIAALSRGEDWPVALRAAAALASSIVSRPVTARFVSVASAPTGGAPLRPGSPDGLSR
jgi:sugar/nucleoside kinase (ribokinase family)